MPWSAVRLSLRPREVATLMFDLELGPTSDGPTPFTLPSAKEMPCVCGGCGVLANSMVDRHHTQQQQHILVQAAVQSTLFY